MDINEFIHRLHEVKREAGHRPVEVVFVPRPLKPKGFVEIKFDAAPGAMDAPATPKITVSYSN